ncbi:MAG: restriction endonuclease [Anaerolineae bacterium]|nr:restriction endonuclease [Anaerolineae bacterium]NUQ05205.1 restriction endonuclease [Anaerolineae bacterium]
MDKLIEARALLSALGLPTAQQSEMSGLTLLVLAGLSENDTWAVATRRSLRVHDILTEIKTRYGRAYAENTRETVRRQVLHQFEQAGIVLRNPDDPTLATNSPRTHYALTEAMLKVLHAYGSSDWETQLAAFRDISGALFELYQRDRQQNRVPLMHQGQTYQLSPGEHNKLQAAVIAEFGPRFAPGAKLLYLGDSENKRLIIDEEELARLNIPFTHHDKLPDIVLYDETVNTLYLIEAVTSHGPVSHKRRVELERMLVRCEAGRIYVSAFPDFATFRGFITEIAWETEVWLSEIPAHLIHFDGDHYLSPRK